MACLSHSVSERFILRRLAKQIETALTYDFSDDLERGVAMANKSINRPLGNGVVMSGKITDAGLDWIAGAR